MQFKWCTKFLDYLKQSLSSQNDNPSAFALSLESCPTQHQKGIAPAYLAPLPALCHWAGRGAKNSARKAPSQVLGSIRISAIQESPPLGGSLASRPVRGVLGFYSAQGSAPCWDRSSLGPNRPGSEEGVVHWEVGVRSSHYPW